MFTKPNQTKTLLLTPINHLSTTSIPSGNLWVLRLKLNLLYDKEEKGKIKKRTQWAVIHFSHTIQNQAQKIFYKKELSWNFNNDHFAHPLKFLSIYLLQPLHLIIVCFFFDVWNDSYAKKIQIQWLYCLISQSFHW